MGDLIESAATAVGGLTHLVLRVAVAIPVTLTQWAGNSSFWAVAGLTLTVLLPAAVAICKARKERTP